MIIIRNFFTFILKVFLVFCLFFFSFIEKINALTIDEAIQKIVTTSPEVGIIFEKRQQSLDNYLQASALYYPQIYALLERTYVKDPVFDPSEGEWSGLNKVTFTLQQRIFDMPTLTNINTSKQQMQSDEYRNQQSLEAAIVNAIQAYYNVIQGEYSVSITKDYMRQVKEVERLIIFMYRNGDATLGDVNFVQARVASVNSLLINSYGLLDSARVRLAYMLGLITPEQSINAADVLPDLTTRDFFDLADRMIALIPENVSDLQQIAINNSADVLIVRSDLCVTQYKLDGANSLYMPVANVFFELIDEQTDQTPEFSRYGKVRFNLSYTFYDGGSRVASISSAASTVREYENHYAVAVRDTRELAFNTYNQLKSLEAQKASLLAEIESTEQVDRVYALQVKFATRNLTDRLDNLERLYQARVNLLNTDYNILNARVAVLKVTGRMIDFFNFEELIQRRNYRLC